MLKLHSVTVQRPRLVHGQSSELLAEHLWNQLTVQQSAGPAQPVGSYAVPVSAVLTGSHSQ